LSSFDFKVGALDYIVLGNYTEADKWLTSAVEFNSKDADAWYYLGRAKYFEGSFAEAIVAYQRCTRISPTSARAKDGLGLTLEQLGRVDDAIQAFRDGIAAQASVRNSDPQLFIDLGALLVRQNRAQEALPYLHQALQLAPTDVAAHEQLGRAYMQLGQFENAQTQLQAAVTSDEQSPSLHLLLGQVYQREGLSERARQEFQRSSNLYGSHSSGDTSR
jgi:Flp pilus assembly protein TadD